MATDRKLIPDRRTLVKWLEGFAIAMGKFNIHEDLSVDVAGDIFINHDELEGDVLPVKFRRVDGEFNCRCCTLRSLENAPSSAWHFNCGSNSLKTISQHRISFPQLGSGTASYVCDKNDLRDVFCQFKAVDCFVCRDNPELRTLEAGPLVVGTLDCRNCPSLLSLAGMPHVTGELLCDEHLMDTREYENYLVARKLAVL